jgi:hypothetical protein
MAQVLYRKLLSLLCGIFAVRRLSYADKVDGQAQVIVSSGDLM